MLETFSATIPRFVFCFVTGSIPFAMLAMLGSGIDIRRIGSGNPGFNNVLRVSKWRAGLTLVGDVGKGFLPVWLVMRLWALPDAGHGWLHVDTVALGWIYGFGAILGHCYSPFLRFNGGKGIATSGGVMLVLYARWAAIALAFFAIVRVTASRLKWSEAGMIASLATWVFFVLLMLLFVGPMDATYAGLMTLFLAWRHKRNFLNLVAAPTASQTR